MKKKSKDKRVKERHQLLTEVQVEIVLLVLQKE